MDLELESFDSGDGCSIITPEPSIDCQSNGHIDNPPSMEMVCVKEDTELSAESVVIDVVESPVPLKMEVEEIKDDPLSTSEPQQEEFQIWMKCFKDHILKPILKHNKSGPFRKPVDAVALGIYPIYYQVIKHPMDLGTIRRKIDTRKYSSKQACIDDLMLVWTNALTFNPPMHFVYNAALDFKKLSTQKLDRLEKLGASAFVSSKKAQSKRSSSSGQSRPRKEQVRRSQSHSAPTRTMYHRPPQPAPLPQYHQYQQQPQHRQVSSSNNGLQACGTLLRNLLSLQNHTDFIKPFLITKPQFSGHVPISLTHIDRKLRTNLYRHYTEFAEDMRQMITDTYKYNNPESPMVTAAGKLQKEFELRFAKINFDDARPICPPILPAGEKKILQNRPGLSDEDQFAAKLQSAQNFMKKIEAELNRLIRDYHKMKSRRKRVIKEEDDYIEEIACGNGQSNPISYVAKENTVPAIAKSEEKKSFVQHHNPPLEPLQAKAINPQQNTTPYHPPVPKKPRLDPPPVLTLQEANELKEQISQLHPDQQLQILEILQNNGEQLFPDEHGEVEIEISKCCAGSVKQVRAYLENLRARIKEESAVSSTVDQVGFGASQILDGNGKAATKSSSDSSSSDDGSSSDSSDSSSDSD